MNVVPVLSIIAAASVAFLVTRTNACNSNIKDFSSTLTSLFGGGTKFSRSMAVPLTIKNMVVAGRVTVGTPKKGDKEEVFTLYINLLSRNSWLHSVDLCPGGNCNEENFKAVGPLKSTTFNRKNRRIDLLGFLEYFRGYISEEKFKFGSGEGAPAAVLEFLEVTVKSSGYQGYDGILGLDLQETDPSSHTAVVASLSTQLKEAMFGFYIYKAPKDDEHGLMIMGGNDAALIDGPVHSHNVVLGRNGELSGWNIKLDKLLIINTDGTREELRLSVNTASPAPALEDIGVPVLQYTLLTSALLVKYGLAALTGRTVPCENDLKTLPSIALVMDGEEYVLTPEEYVRRSSQTNICVLAFQYGAGSKMLLGQVFMKKYYTRFNIKHKQVQFAKAKQELLSN